MRLVLALLCMFVLVACVAEPPPSILAVDVTIVAPAKSSATWQIALKPGIRDGRDLWSTSFPSPYGKATMFDPSFPESAAQVTCERGHGEHRFEGLKAGAYTVFLTNGAGGVGVAEVPELRAGETRAIHVTVDLSRTLRGRVVDSNGGGIANADIALGSWAEGFEFEGNSKRYGVATTDTDGRFAVTFPPAGICQISAYAEGYAPGWVRLSESGAESQDAVIVLSPPVSIKGVVLCDKTPLADQLVLATYPQGDDIMFGRNTTTDSNGQFQFDEMPYGTAEVSVDVMPRVPGLQVRARTSLLISEEAEGNAILSLPALTATLRGKITWTGQSLEKCTVDALMSGQQGAWVAEGWTPCAADGTFVFSGIPAGEAVLGFTCRASDGTLRHRTHRVQIEYGANTAVAIDVPAN